MLPMLPQATELPTFSLLKTRSPLSHVVSNSTFLASFLRPQWWHLQSPCFYYKWVQGTQAFTNVLLKVHYLVPKAPTHFRLLNRQHSTFQYKICIIYLFIHNKPPPAPNQKQQALAYSFCVSEIRVWPSWVPLIQVLWRGCSGAEATLSSRFTWATPKLTQPAMTRLEAAWAVSCRH